MNAWTSMAEAWVPMVAGDLDEVEAVERVSYPVPWKRGHFLASLEAGHLAWCLRDPHGRLAAYCVLMPAVDDMHVLNLTVAPPYRRHGIAGQMLTMAIEHARAAGMQSLLLEVRPSNTPAIAAYRHYRFVEIGRRRAYYPQADGGREDAIVMRLALDATEEAH